MSWCSKSQSWINNYNGGHGVDKDLTKAADRSRKGADAVFDEAQLRLAKMYYDGGGVAKSFKEARKWSKKAADKNNSEAQLKLGKMMIKKEGSTAGSVAEGVTLIQKSADQGNVDALAYLDKVAQC